MTVTVTNNAEVTVPQKIRRQAGIKAGDRVEFKVSGGIINIIPALPSADAEYTPSQRRAIDAQLRQARKGPYHGPFPSAEQAIKFLRKEIKTRKAIKRKSGGHQQPSSPLIGPPRYQRFSR